MDEPETIQTLDEMEAECHGKEKITDEENYLLNTELLLDEIRTLIQADDNCQEYYEKIRKIVEEIKNPADK